MHLNEMDHFPMVYRYTLWYRILGVIGGVILAGLFGFIGSSAVVASFMTARLEPVAIVLLLISCPMFVVIVLGIFDAFVHRFIIDTDRFIVRSVFSKKELPYSEVKGFRMEVIRGEFTMVNLCIVPRNASYQVIRFYFWRDRLIYGKKESASILNFLRAHFDDLGTSHNASIKRAQ